MRWIGLIVFFESILCSCGVQGVFYSEIIQDHPNIINRPDSLIVYSYHVPFHKIQIKNRGLLEYQKIKRGCTMNTDTTLNAQGKWRQSGDTIFLNFPTHFENHWHKYIISSNNDTLTPVRSKEVTRYIKK